MIDKYIRIGKSRIEISGNQARLASNIEINHAVRTMYFGVDSQHENSLSVGRADPFLAAVVNFAMKSGRDIVCEDPVSETMLFGIRHLYIPTLSFWSEAFSAVEIKADTVSEPIRSRHAVGAAMSFGCDSLYTFFRHGHDSEYPITHLCNFNNGVYGDEISFAGHSEMLARFAAERGLVAIAVDTNIHTLMPERFLEVYTQRNLACVLALQGLFGTYLYSAGHDEEHVAINPENPAYYDVVTTEAFSTDSLQFVLSGSETTRVGKLQALLAFPDAHRYLHPCFKNPIGEKNCGHCKKDIREMILFYAWGKEKDFDQVYDWTDFEKNLPMNLAILLSLSDDHLYRNVLDEYKKSGKEIPAQSWQYAEMYRKAMKKNK